jgi:hypothetical protein
MRYKPTSLKVHFYESAFFLSLSFFFFFVILLFFIQHASFIMTKQKKISAEELDRLRKLFDKYLKKEMKDRNENNK